MTDTGSKDLNMSWYSSSQETGTGALTFPGVVTSLWELKQARGWHYPHRRYRQAYSD